VTDQTPADMIGTLSTDHEDPDNTIVTAIAGETTIFVRLQPDDVAALVRTLMYRPGAPERGQCRSTSIYQTFEETDNGMVTHDVEMRCEHDAGHEGLHEDGDIGWSTVVQP
jgi:hypothetical protein